MGRVVLVSTELSHILWISALIVLAGVIGFVVGGKIEMRRYYRDLAARREAKALEDSSDTHALTS